MSATVFGFHTGCVYEGICLVSLHETEEGARQAARDAMEHENENSKEFEFEHGRPTLVWRELSPVKWGQFWSNEAPEATDNQCSSVMLVREHEVNP